MCVAANKVFKWHRLKFTQDHNERTTMKSPFRTLFLGAALVAAAVPALAQTNVHISVGQPGFYGRLDLGDFGARPVVYTRQPVIVREVRHMRAEPIYLRVPPGHRRSWSRYCGRYDACGRPVMFVRDDWYTNTYAPHYRARHGHHGYREVREVRYVERHDGRHGHDRHERHDRHDRHDGPGHGHGNGHGTGPGRGH
jgi:hypothetical protein